MKIVGLDVSLTATGVSSDQGSGVIGYKMPSPASYMDEVKRLRYLGVQIDRACRGADIVVIENFAHGKHQRAHQLGELHGVIKVTLLQRGTPFVLVPPAKLKKFAVDHGGAPKDSVFAAAIRDGFDGTDKNAGEAWWLRRMAYEHYVQHPTTKYREQVLVSIRWPRLGREQQSA